MNRKASVVRPQSMTFGFYLFDELHRKRINHQAERGLCDMLRFIVQFPYRSASGAGLDDLAQPVYFLVGEMLDAHEEVFRGAHANELVKFDLYGRAVAILRILDKKNHQESNDCRSCIDDELPNVGIPKHRACQPPDGHDKGRFEESPGPAGLSGDSVGRS
jgi:hypothetical protein